MKEITPLVENAKVLRIDGKFPIQLELPPESTLTQSDIERISGLATWSTNPNGNVGRFEGGRSVIVKRETPREIKGYDFRALQVSGIGYFPGDPGRGNATVKDLENRIFLPPHRGNFMGEVGGVRAMGTSHSVGGVVIDTRPTYRACGTYTEEELKSKVEKTRRVSSLPLTKMIASPIEAYGRYTGEDLIDDTGAPLGFMVVPAPNIVRRRIGDSLQDKLVDKITGELRLGRKLRNTDALLFLAELVGAMVPPFIRGIRELHDMGRVAHLQAHLNNAYCIDGVPYVLDWSTAEALNGNVEDNVVNRVIDLSRSADNLAAIYRAHVGLNEIETEALYVEALYPTVMEAYSPSNRPVNFLVEGAIATRELKRDAYAFEILVSWLRRKGLEK